MPNAYVAIPASSKSTQMMVSAIILCAYVHCLFIRGKGVVTAVPALLVDLIELPDKYKGAMVRPYSMQRKGTCEKESRALERFQLSKDATPCPAYRKRMK